MDGILKTIGNLASRFRPHIPSGARPRPGSAAACERMSVGHNTALLQILGALPERARESLELCGDAGVSISRALRFSARDATPPARYTPAGIARDALEASVIALWLLEPDIDVDERGRRTIAVMREDYEEQRKFTEANARDHPQFQKEMEAAVQWVRDERRRFEALAGATGLASRGRPSSTKLTRRVLGTEFDYRLFSALSHGRPWALETTRLMYEERSGLSGGAVWFNFAFSVVENYSQAVWALSAYMDPDGLPALRQTLEGLYDDCKMKDEPRDFFRQR